jgi:hypothetical protein
MILASRRLVIFGVVSALLGACARAEHKPYRLPSGSEIKVLGSGKIYLTGEKRWALTFKYETTVPMSDTAAVRAEATEIMNSLKSDVDKARLSLCLLTAQSPATGVIVKRREAANFVMEKDTSGKWALK